MNQRVKRVAMPIASAMPFATVARRLDRGRDGALPVVVCVDVEPDGRVVDPGAAGPWRSFERVVPWMQSLRDRLSEVTEAPAAFTWCLRMDPQIDEVWGSPTWAAETYGDVLAEVEASGDELGLHTHTWRLEADSSTWFTDHDPAWGRHCAQMGLDAFEAAFGRSCRAHRGGDHVMSGEILDCLRQAGVKIDLTVEPGLPPTGPPLPTERANGVSPDYRGVPTGPYRSSPAMFPEPDPAGGTDPLLVPQANGPPLRGAWISTIGIVTHPSLFAARILRELRRRPPRVLVFAMRTDPDYLLNWSRIAKNLEHLARHRGVRFATASAAAEALT